MANDFRTPGVFVEEKQLFPPATVQVPTAVPVFIGYTERIKYQGENLINNPQRVRSYIEYIEKYGNPQKEENIEVSVTGPAGSYEIAVDFKKTNQGKPIRSRHVMNYCIDMYFRNGGGPCWVVSVGQYLAFNTPISQGNDTTGLRGGLNEVKKVDEPTLILFPEAQGLDSPASYYSLAESALLQCKDLKDRFVLIEVYHDTYDSQLSAIDSPRINGGMRESVSGDLSYGAVYYPNLETTLSYHGFYDDNKVTVDISGQKTTLDKLLGTDDVLYAQIKSKIRLLRVILPPASAIAGVYARVDRNRGVWKAPANEPILNVVRPKAFLTKDDNDRMNVDEKNGKSVNAIRSFSGKGVYVWGARTLAGNDNEWRYISVRRFFIMVEESAKKATERFVFEPNDANTWVKVQAMIENFLMLQWRAGALAGAQPEQAFYVQVGLGKTMTQDDILNGKMIIEIGLAVVRPAEFIVLRFMHKMQES